MCLFIVFSAFGLESDAAIDFHFVNNLYAPVECWDLPDLIEQYKNSGSFCIELVLQNPFLTIKAEVKLTIFYTLKRIT